MKLKYDEPLSNFAFNLNVRPCNGEARFHAALAAAAAAQGTGAAVNPCGFVGRVDVEAATGVTLTGSGDYPACLAAMRAQLAQLQAGGYREQALDRR